jgi:tetratricopeptide (TPR) repeat protein
MIKIGDRVSNRYEIVKALGRGGMGKVFLARDLLEGEKLVALKTIRPERFTLDKVEYLKREFMMLTHLSHPNLVKVYDFVFDPELIQFYFTSEYVVGSDLYTATEGRRARDITPLVVQICRALAYIHSRGIIHYDLKPSNIMVTAVEEVKLLDFGLAQELKGDEPLLPAGTVSYMAPEVARGTDVDTRSDLYSLGVVMFQILARHMPNYFVSTNGSMFLDATPLPKPPDIAKTGIREPYRSIIPRLVDVNPDGRFREANDVIRVINRLAGRSYLLETSGTKEGYIFSGKFIGREKEFAFLESCLDAKVLSEKPGTSQYPTLVLLEGAAGLGKDRVIREFKYKAQIQGVSFLQTDCFEDEEEPYRPVEEILRQAVLILGEGHENVARHAESIRRLAPDLAPGWDVMSGGHERPTEAAFQTDLAAFFLEFSTRIPAVICFNDLHLADSLTVEFIGRLAATESDIPGSKILVLAAFDPEGFELSEAGKALKGLKSAPGSRELVLAPFTEAETAGHIAHIFNLPEIDGAFIRRAWKLTDGNPLLIELMLKSLTDKGIIVRTKDTWEIDVRRALSEPLSRSLSVLFEEELSRLGKRERRVLKILSCFERPVDRALLLKLLYPAETSAENLIRSLTVKGIIKREKLSGLPAYAFARRAMRGIIYESMDADARKSMHRRIAQTAEAHYREALPEHAAFVAHHYWLGRLPERAGALWLLEGDRLMREMSNLDEVEKYYSNAYKAYRKNPRERIRTTFRLISLMIAREQWEKAESAVGRILQRRPGAYAKMMSSHYLGVLASRMGDEGAAFNHFEDAIQLAKRLKAIDQVMASSEEISFLHFRRGDMASARKYLEYILELNMGRDDAQSVITSLNRLAILEERLGNFPRAEECLKRALMIAENRRLALMEARTLGELGEFYMKRGDYQRALPSLKKAGELGRMSANAFFTATIWDSIARLFVLRYQPRRAVAFAEKAAALREERGIKTPSARPFSILGHSCRLMGDFGRARDIFTRNHELMTASGDTAGIARGYLDLGALEIDENHFDAAEERLSAALGMFTDLRDVPSLMETLLMLAQVHVLRGEPDRAFDCLGRVEPMIIKTGVIEQRFRFILVKALALARRGDVEKAGVFFEGAVMQAEVVEPYYKALALFHYGAYLAGRGAAFKKLARGLLDEAGEILRTYESEGLRKMEHAGVEKLLLTLKG